MPSSSKSRNQTLIPTPLPTIAQSPDSSPDKRQQQGSNTIYSDPVTPSSKAHGKRRADDLERTPPDERDAAYHRAVRASEHENKSNTPPSSFPNNAKRARISSTSSHSRPPSSQNRVDFANEPSHGVTDGATYASSSEGRHSHTTPNTHSRTHSRSHSRNASVRRGSLNLRSSLDGRFSAMSIPISAVVSPHAPSLGAPSSNFHMRDPRKPAKIHPTPWALLFPTADEPGSPIHAWFFFIGFIPFPLWWIASFLPVPKTRHLGGHQEKVPLDDPQKEFDAHTWRRRCRWMAGISLITYVPFIVLIAVFVTRRV